MFWGSKESVTVRKNNLPLSHIDIYSAEVKNIWSASRDSFVPDIIEFTDKGGKEHKYHGAGLLKKVCKAWKKGERHVFFTATLFLEGDTIIRVEDICWNI